MASSDSSSSKMSLFKELKRKMGIQTEDEDEATGTSTGRSTSTSTNKHVGNTRAKKESKKHKTWLDSRGENRQAPNWRGVQNSESK